MYRTVRCTLHLARVHLCVSLSQHTLCVLPTSGGLYTRPPRRLTSPYNEMCTLHTTHTAIHSKLSKFQPCHGGSLAIDPSSQGQGLGSLLVNTVLQEYVKKTCPSSINTPVMTSFTITDNAAKFQVSKIPYSKVIWTIPLFF